MNCSNLDRRAPCATFGKSSALETQAQDTFNIPRTQHNKIIPIQLLKVSWFMSAISYTWLYKATRKLINELWNFVVLPNHSQNIPDYSEDPNEE